MIIHDMIHKKIEVYVDDIIIKSCNISNHRINFIWRHSNQIFVYLTSWAFLHILATIIFHSHPEVTGS